MPKYRFIDDLTSDVMFEAYGHDLPEVFANAAEAMFSVICKINRVRPDRVVEIDIKAGNKGELMISWLQELIGLVDTDDMFFSRFEILEINERHLHAKVHGEEIRPELGETVVKAVTYYKFKFERTVKGYVARVSLDI